ncbi:hypothetical protein KMZ68_14950 [Bradyrhizobium sediminis]|uniref:Uncharacterized protein n=1 Tax=Bradyrhizobium sediminis TaxID=2840469 RepID=A0A975NK66_9BRAD|nr:hypothetical protein [Bradyrhizobium sediminis]QWG16325.1 hypothetical protein KMZ68_14950 [Bradyrhizobium sediminis]
MSRTNLRLLTAHVAIPFATGAGLGAFFLCAVYYLDVGSMRTLVTASGGSILDIGLIPIACAFGSLAIGTNQAIGFLIDN